MLDTHFRYLIQPLFERCAEFLERRGWRPLPVTCAALVTGLLAALGFGLGCTVVPLLLLWVSGFLDVVDGTLARRLNASSPFGALCDLLFDRIVEMAVILAAALRFPDSRLACVLLLCAIIFCFSIFLIVGNLSVKESTKAFYYQAGLTERTETFIIFSMVLLMPNYTTEIFVVFAALVLFTGVQRFREAMRFFLPMLLALSALASGLLPMSAQAASWDETLNAARGTTVTLYGWGGDLRINRWLDTWVAPRLLDKYGITLERVGMDIGTVLGSLRTQKTHGGNETGSMDVVWINGENFAAARQHDLLWGPFVQTLPNAALLADSFENTRDFGIPTEGFESPWGRAQVVLFGTPAAAAALESGPEGFLAYAMDHPGRLSYPAPPDFTGSAFVRSVALGILSPEALAELRVLGELNGQSEQNERANAELKTRVAELTLPLFDWLERLTPHLWRQGKHYPATAPLMTNMYADGELDMGLSYTPYLSHGKVQNDEFPPDTRAFAFKTGTVGNTHFLAVPFNAPNRNAALVLINELLSPEAQAAKLTPSVWGDLPVLPVAAMAPAKATEAVPEVAPDTASEDDFAAMLESRRSPELPAKLVPILDALWRERLLKTK